MWLQEEASQELLEIGSNFLPTKSSNTFEYIEGWQDNEPIEIENYQQAMELNFETEPKPSKKKIKVPMEKRYNNSKTLIRAEHKLPTVNRMEKFLNKIDVFGSDFRSKKDGIIININGSQDAKKIYKFGRQTHREK